MTATSLVKTFALSATVLAGIATTPTLVSADVYGGGYIPTPTLDESTRSVRQLNILEETGFSEPASGKIATFDTDTNEIHYRNGITATTPSGNNYDYKQLVGHTADGKSVKLTDAQQVEDLWTYAIDASYKLSDEEMSKYTYFTVEVQYRSPIEPQKAYNANAKFSIN